MPTQIRKKNKRMGPPTGSRAANATETRDRILKAGVTQFALHGFTGARIDSICTSADVNARMVYHYFNDKAGLYIAVLEYALGQLRTEELNLDVSKSEPLDGLLKMFDFMFDHFSEHPELIRLLSAENLLQAKFLKSSDATPIMASPVISHIRTLIQKGIASKSIRSDVDPLHLYVAMVAFCYFHKSNCHSLAVIFGAEIMSQQWRAEHKSVARKMLVAYLAP